MLRRQLFDPTVRGADSARIGWRTENVALLCSAGLPLRRLLFHEIAERASFLVIHAQTALFGGHVREGKL